MEKTFQFILCRHTYKNTKSLFEGWKAISEASKQGKRATNLLIFKSPPKRKH